MTILTLYISPDGALYYHLYQGVGMLFLRLKRSSVTVGAPEVCVYVYVSKCVYGEANHGESESRNIITDCTYYSHVESAHPK
jgi:hypothetical protein